MSNVRLCRDDERAAIVAIINAAAEAYRGVIPGDCWREPYMPREGLESEIAANVVFWGYEESETLIGVMGLQSVSEVEPDSSRLYPPRQPAPRDRRRAGQASAAPEHAAYAGRRLGCRRLGDPFL